MPHDSTLFHLVPDNDLSKNILNNPKNRRFVSSTAGGKLGLEIGFHVSNGDGNIIARLGRDTDLILSDPSVSRIHVHFELHVDTYLMMLSVRTRQESTVLVTPEKGNEEIVDGSCVLSYHKPYTIAIASYLFKVVWRQLQREELISLAKRDYDEAQANLSNIPSQGRPTIIASRVQTWFQTIVQTATQNSIVEVPGERTFIGSGGFGSVYRTIDRSGNAFAVKVLRLSSSNDENRASAHRELQMLQNLKHAHIIEYLGSSKWDTMEPEIYMPLRPGSLRSLASSLHPSQEIESGDKLRNQDPQILENDDKLCTQVLQQMLAALDFLGKERICHRDVKPDNILYYDIGDGNYCFQLGDFGLAKEQQRDMTQCGTFDYMAPEILWCEYPQTPAVDIWSLFVTIIDVHQRFSFPPPSSPYTTTSRAIQDAAKIAPLLASMVHENPANRATPEQLLKTHFDGRGVSSLPTDQVGASGPQPLRAQATAQVLPLVQYPQPRRQGLRPRANGRAQIPVATRRVSANLFGRLSWETKA